MPKKPVMLVILDGWGIREDASDNAIKLAKTPHFDRLLSANPHATLRTSGRDVGLPDGQMGNSEVGHTNIGAGRVVMQDLPRIATAIEDGSLAETPALKNLIDAVRATGGTCHLMGLLSAGGVHGHTGHAVALATILRSAGVPVAIHVWTDGRDTPPRSAGDVLRGAAWPDGARIATVCGRYYAMDRDNRWDRVSRAYAAMVDAKGGKFADAASAIDDAYQREVTDEFVAPAAIGDYAGMRDGDALLSWNFRADRVREILAALLDPGFDGFARPRTVTWSAAAGMTRYSDDFAPAAAAGAYSTHDIKAAYVERIAGDVKIARPIKIAIDCGNGVAGMVAGDLFRAMGCEVVELFCDVDGHFPNHHPDPAHPENLQDLIRSLHGSDAEIGLAFDGDGDRLGVVTKDGRIIFPDRQMMLYAADVLARNPGAEILYDVKCTRHLGPWIAAHGGRPLMWKTGHSLVKAKLKETGAPLGGEMSGHIFWKDRWFGFDDGLYTGARLLEIVTRVADTAALLNALPEASSTPELHLHLQEGENFELIEKLRAEAQFPGSERIVDIDGLRVEYPDGFGLARGSNTTPVVVLRFEGENPAALARIQGEFARVILAARPDAVLPF